MSVYLGSNRVGNTIGAKINNQNKTVSSSETNQSVTFDSGNNYTGLGTVTITGLGTTYVGSGVTRKTAATITPTTTNQTIASDTYLTGTQTISGDANLVAGNIKSGVSIFGVNGSYSGSSKNIQTNQTTSRTSNTSLTSVNSLTCSTAGTYDIYWTCFRSSTSGTWSSQLYVGGTAYGAEQTTWSNHAQTVKLTGVSLSANQTVAVYVKARGTNYYGYAPQLTIVQTA